MFSPCAVALIGASEKTGSVGRAILENLLSSKDLKVFPVNPNYKTLSGTQCYPTINEVPRANRPRRHSDKGGYRASER